MPIPDLEDKDKQEIKEVKDKAIIKKMLYYLIKQKGQPTKYNQQILKEYIENAQEAIKRYEKNKRQKTTVTLFPKQVLIRTVTLSFLVTYKQVTLEERQL